MWRRIDRHIKAGALAGIMLPLIWGSILLQEAPEWRTPPELLVTFMLGLFAGMGAGTITRWIEKLASRRIPIIVSIFLALIAGLFITAFLTSAQ